MIGVPPITKNAVVDEMQVKAVKDFAVYWMG
jgi:hypothetical protein